MSGMCLEDTARYRVVGRSPVLGVTTLAGRRGVDVVADVPEIAPFVARARVAVIPLLMGSGTRLKALEAMAAGRPVVGTTIGLAGLGVENRRHAVVADDPASMAHGIVELATDDGLASRLVAEGRRLVEDRFGWDRIGARFADALLETPAGRP